MEAGYSIYTPFTLRLYDLFVLQISCRWIWGCPASNMLDLYNRHLGLRHLEMGVGTGWFLKHCRPVARPLHVTLADANPACLRAAKEPIGHLNPHTVQANIFEPLSIDGPLFDSVGLNFVLHCLPGSFSDKSVALRHLSAVLTPDGVLFGSTLIAQGGRHTAASRLLMALYNHWRIFSNRSDTVDGLQQALQEHFHEHSVWTSGCVALFVARTPRRSVAVPVQPVRTPHSCHCPAGTGVGSGPCSPGDRDERPPN